jgi:hypothetical protein
MYEDSPNGFVIKFENNSDNIDQLMLFSIDENYNIINVKQIDDQENAYDNLAVNRIVFVSYVDFGYMGLQIEDLFEIDVQFENMNSKIEDIYAEGKLGTLIKQFAEELSG